jgi:hypothetical protein
MCLFVWWTLLLLLLLIWTSESQAWLLGWMAWEVKSLVRSSMVLWEYCFNGPVWCVASLASPFTWSGHRRRLWCFSWVRDDACTSMWTYALGIDCTWSSDHTWQMIMTCTFQSAFQATLLFMNSKPACWLCFSMLVMVWLLDFTMITITDDVRSGPWCGPHGPHLHHTCSSRSTAECSPLMLQILLPGSGEIKFRVECDQKMCGRVGR